MKKGLFSTYAARLVRAAKSKPVLTVAAIAALVSMLFVCPDAQYADYFDWHTLLCLWAMLSVLCAFRSIGAFRILAARLVMHFKTSRSVVIALVLASFVGSAFLTNDMMLLTLLPLTAMVLSVCGQQERIAFTFIMQTLAANLGGMILPFGNPQNLYLFSYYNLGLAEFAGVLAPPFLASLVMIVGCCLFVKPTPLKLQKTTEESLPGRRFALYLVLFVAVIAAVFNLVPYVAVWAVIVVLLVILDRESQRHVDYSLLLTFCCFFVFSGNLTRIPLVQEALSSLLNNGGAFLVSCIASQAISNVPSAILFAPFTTDWAGLLLGVDIGGLGTPVASLASLIAIAEFQRCMPGETGRFVLRFEMFNFAFLVVLVALALLGR